MPKDLNLYTIDEALSKVKKSSRTKFDATIELHINLILDNENIRFTTTPPHKIGKENIIAVLASKKIPEADLELTEDDLSKIESGEIKPAQDFDVFITEPKYMSKIAKVAKVLGPLGLMPNPKTGTVTEKVLEAVMQFKKGKVEIKTEKSQPLIHTVVGKISMDNKKIKDNIINILNALKHNKPKKFRPDWINKIYLTATMSPSFQIDPGQI